MHKLYATKERRGGGHPSYEIRGGGAGGGGGGGGSGERERWGHPLLMSTFGEAMWGSVDAGTNKGSTYARNERSTHTHARTRVRSHARTHVHTLTRARTHTRNNNNDKSNQYTYNRKQEKSMVKYKPSLTETWMGMTPSICWHSPSVYLPGSPDIFSFFFFCIPSYISGAHNFFVRFFAYMTLYLTQP